ncbi:hypothetical protein OGZ02_13205 [Brachyspira hyodysenteriae]|nr:hypothetical protein [Brachyspira hyodysenteriae]MDA1469770.1 hypothetical protein [Brachyspira hyodysenteriae]
MKEFNILEEKLKDFLDDYQLISFDNKELLQTIDQLKKEKEDLTNSLNQLKDNFNSLKEEKTILEADKRNANDNYNSIREEREKSYKTA